MRFTDKSLEVRREARRFLLGWLFPKMLKNESLCAELNAELRNHWKPNPIDVTELIRENWESIESHSENAPDKRNYIVFIDSDISVDWIADFELSTEAKHAISYAESVGAKRCNHLPHEQILEMRRLVGQAIVNAIEGEAGYSIKLAEEAERFLRDRTVERSRNWTLVSAHLLIVLLSLALASGFNLLSTFTNRADNASALWLCIQGGLIGAYLSTIQKAGKGDWDAAAGWPMHFVEVITKLVAGALFGGIGFALSRSVHAPPSIRELSPDGYSALLLGFAAGMFERLIPKMVSSYLKFDKTEKHLKK